eukprot:1556986-Rhodomonas_salina.1
MEHAFAEGDALSRARALRSGLASSRPYESKLKEGYDHQPEGRIGLEARKTELQIRKERRGCQPFGWLGAHHQMWWLSRAPLAGGSRWEEQVAEGGPGESVEEPTIWWDLPTSTAPGPLL